MIYEKTAMAGGFSIFLINFVLIFERAHEQPPVLGY
jgi:hypothetical protein